MHDIHRHEICRFEHGDLLYRTYFFKDGEIAFTVTGDALRLGLITREDLRWDWDWMRELPGTAETSRIVNVNAQPLRVLRAIALRLAQYLARHRPAKPTARMLGVTTADICSPSFRWVHSIRGSGSRDW